jgi:hypothetical protein
VVHRGDQFERGAGVGEGDGQFAALGERGGETVKLPGEALRQRGEVCQRLLDPSGEFGRVAGDLPGIAELV